MMREWATVVAWSDGIATLRCNQKSGCSGCQSSSTCGVRIVNEIKPEGELEFQLPIEQCLQAGQKVELGISEANLLYSALLIYIVPLLGLFMGAGLCHWLISHNIAAIGGAFIGGLLGFGAAKFYAQRLEKRRFYQPVVLQISLPGKSY